MKVWFYLEKPGKLRETLLRRKKVVNKNQRCCEDYDDDAMKKCEGIQWHTFPKCFSDISERGKIATFIHTMPFVYFSNNKQFFSPVHKTHGHRGT